MPVSRRSFLEISAVLIPATLVARRALAQNTAVASLKDNADAVLAGIAERGDVPGVVAAVTSPAETIYLAAFGERGLGQGVAMTPDTVFNIASMTKPVTATAAMQLVEAGELELDVPISRWAPQAKNLQVLDGWDASGRPILRAPKREVTLRDLMTHTSGFAYGQWDADLARYLMEEKFPELASGEEAAFYPPLMFDPGERWEYGISIDWIGKLVETVSGKSLGTYMQENIFSPLGMASTGYRITPDMEARRATIHQREKDGALTPTPSVRQQEPVREPGGGGLNSTADDYLRFIRMILNDGTENGQQVLKPETVQLMAQNAMGDIRVVMLETTNPSRSLDAEFFPGLPKSWGLSFMINEETAPTGRPAGSLAWAGLYNTFFWIDRSTGLGGVYLTQILPFVDEKALAGFYEFETAVYQA
jgi:methyl acetate hydrolase